MDPMRQRRIEEAFFRGGMLTLENPDYLREVKTLTEALLRVDVMPKDLTVEALGIPSGPGKAVIIAQEPGVIAGVSEFEFLVGAAGIGVEADKKDGEVFEKGDILLRLEGDRNRLLSLERVGLNLLQRMSGIATLTRNLQCRARSRSDSTRVVATRKTLWGLLDKRAVHLGGGGTHRLGLGDAVLIKNNHLALIAGQEEEAAPIAIARSWNFRKHAAFIEVEVRSESAALAAANVFRRLQKESGEEYPCLILLDNLAPGEIHEIVNALRASGLLDYVLVEASGGISEENLERYAETGVDAISMGALTHSVRSLDLCQRIL
jgi:nicotinate-nucleotide pyrophosphorylase (carboxylating)